MTHHVPVHDRECNRWTERHLVDSLQPALRAIPAGRATSQCCPGGIMGSRSQRGGR